jgi:hypothetical protein
MDAHPKLALVRKLLAKAEHHTCPPPEAEALTAKAAELCAEYGLDAALAAAAEGATVLPINRVIRLDAPYAAAKRSLLYTVAKAYRCEGVALSSARLHLFGFPADIDRAEMLFTSLLLQAANAIAETPCPDHLSGAKVTAWANSWMMGFTRAIGARLGTAESAAVSSAQREVTGGRPGVALVLADQSVQVQAAVKSTYPALRMTRRTSSGTGAGAGYRAGQRASLGGSGVSGGSRTAVSS